MCVLPVVLGNYGYSHWVQSSWDPWVLLGEILGILTTKLPKNESSELSLTSVWSFLLLHLHPQTCGPKLHSSQPSGERLSLCPPGGFAEASPGRALQVALLRVSGRGERLMGHGGVRVKMLGLGGRSRFGSRHRYMYIMMWQPPKYINIWFFYVFEWPKASKNKRLEGTITRHFLLPFLIKLLGVPPKK